MNIIINDAEIRDIEALVAIENSCFLSDRLSRRSFSRSLKNPVQLLKVARVGNTAVGYALIHWRQNGKSARLYSLAVLERWRQNGIAAMLVNAMRKSAMHKDKRFLTLEVRANSSSLISFYQQLGFAVQKRIPTYYEDGEDALKMVTVLVNTTTLIQSAQPPVRRQRTLIVVSRAQDARHLNLHLKEDSKLEIIIARQFLNATDRQGGQNHIINLCPCDEYLGSGYYVSLIAEARANRTLPSVDTLSSLVRRRLYKKHLGVLSSLLPQDYLAEHAQERNKISLEFYFGQTDADWARRLCRQCYRLFPAPVLEVLLQRSKDSWEVRYVWPLSFTAVDDKDRPRFSEALNAAVSLRIPNPAFIRHSAFDLAILIDMREPLPPSNSRAISALIRAGKKIDIACSVIEKTDIKRLASFDGLFIRTTTQLNNYSYEFALAADRLGMPVIDDPQSILRCSNKVFLKEVLERAHLHMPKSWLITSGNLNEMAASLALPLVLKIPDGSFSRGVFKIENTDAFLAKAHLLLEKSYVLVAQEFMPTSYDWRVGVLDGRPLFACKYFMSRGHWQIYNHKSNNKVDSGDFETVPLTEVPANVLDAAIRASLSVGNGLYGVDIKEIDGRALIIEVNDNPNIDAGIEDKVIGADLYNQLMTSFHQRILLARAKTQI